MSNFVGRILGYDVERVGTQYVFGCGSVKIPVARVHNFVREVAKRAKEPENQQEKDYRAVIQIANENGHYIDRSDYKSILNLFGKQMEAPANQPVKKTVKKVVKKAAKKK